MILQMQKIIILIIFYFVIEIYLTVASYQFFKNGWIIINQGEFV